MGEEQQHEEEAPEVPGIDVGAVTDWIATVDPTIEPPLQFRLIRGGYSNLTFEVTDAAGRRRALRRPPLGSRLGSAHDMAREHRVVSALRGTEVAVPPVLGLCEGEDVTGAPFYVMDFVDGPVLRNPADAVAFPDPGQRHAIGRKVVETLVALHAVDPDAVGLGDLGRPDVQVSAAVDWELCTLGDPLADVGLLMVYWAEPGDETLPLIEPATRDPGFPSRAELAELYEQLSGRDLGRLDFYTALGYWKLAIILEGVFARFSAGKYGEGADESYRQFAAVVERLAEAAADAYPA